MTKLLTLPGSTALGCVIVSITASTPSASPTARPLAVHQEPRGIGHLVARGDRVEIAYGVDTPGIRSATGFLYVRNDLQPRFERLALTREKRSATGLRVLVPRRLLRGHELLYYAVVRDPKSGRLATIPAAGAASPRTAWILDKPVVVGLGTHRFGHPRPPEAVVARAAPSEVGWQMPPPGGGPDFGPQTFLAGPDGSIWLHDVNDRLLVWRPGRPDEVDRAVPLPFGSTDNDVALGPAGTVYVTGGVGRGLDFHHVLYRLSSTGQVLWRSRLAGEIQDSGSFLVGVNSPLRVGPDGTLYCLAGMPGLPGGERGWMPVATPGGRPLSVAEQRRRTHWPFQPVAGGLRLLSEVYTAQVDTAPHEARFALIDRHGRIVRAWRVVSRTDINFGYATPELVGGDPVVVLDATAAAAAEFKWEYVVLRLGPRGTRARFSLRHAVYGDNLLADVRVGPDGKLYQLGSSPSTGVEISRYSLGPVRSR